VKPDLDNLVKLLKDAGNKLVWMDDAIICQLTARKFYDDLNLGERIELRVSLLDQSGSAAGNAGLGLICSETCVTQAS
jgi:Holliday junction resolvase RusA-like endonuclease